MPMRRVSKDEYRHFVGKHSHVRVADSKVRFRGNQTILSTGPEAFTLERWNLWSFPERGKWATHNGDYRGNWSPYIPRNLILRYSRPGEIVLDPMMGSGTTLVECKLLGRRGIGIDINLQAVYLTRDRLSFVTTRRASVRDIPPILTYQGDARYLDAIEDDTADLITVHPPYANIIRYTRRGQHEGDLSTITNLPDFCVEMKLVARECLRTLKPGGQCAILLGDMRKRGHHVPLAFRVLQVFLEVGFLLREDVIKSQWNTASESRWSARPHDFLLLAYEHLFVLRKPGSSKDAEGYPDSSKWW